jgi:hypothetical protein
MKDFAQSQILAMNTFGVQQLGIEESVVIVGGDNTATVSVGSPGGLTLSGGSGGGGGRNWYSYFFSICDNA